MSPVNTVSPAQRVRDFFAQQIPATMNEITSRAGVPVSAVYSTKSTMKKNGAEFYDSHNPNGEPTTVMTREPDPKTRKSASANNGGGYNGHNGNGNGLNKAGLPRGNAITPLLPELGSTMTVSALMIDDAGNTTIGLRQNGTAWTAEVKGRA